MLYSFTYIIKIFAQGETSSSNKCLIVYTINGIYTRSNLFDSIVSSSTSRDVVCILDVLDPRLAWRPHLEWPPCKESEVTVRHVVVLSAEQKPCHHRDVRVTIDDHCHTVHNTSNIVFSTNTFLLFSFFLIFSYALLFVLFHVFTFIPRCFLYVFVLLLCVINDDDDDDDKVNILM